MAFQTLENYRRPSTETVAAKGVALMLDKEAKAKQESAHSCKCGAHKCDGNCKCGSGHKCSEN